MWKTIINSSTISFNLQHIATRTHKENIQCKEKFKQSFFLSTPISSNSKSVFHTDLYCTLTRSDILLFKLLNPDFKMFLEKYTGQSILDENTAEKLYSRHLSINTFFNSSHDSRWAHLGVHQWNDRRRGEVYW